MSARFMYYKLLLLIIMMINVITGIIIFSLNLKVKINKYEEKKTTLEFHFSILMFKK